MNKNNIGRYMQFALVILAAGSVFPLIYLKAQYQETILEVFNMTLEQMNWIYSILGIVFLVGYFPSGILSDKFSAKKLLVVSLLGTAAGGFWFAQVPTYEYVVLIFAIWGFFAVFTFWGSHMKLTKMLAAEGEEGRFFGILDGGRGLVEALLGSIALAIFSWMLGDSLEIEDKKSALEAIIYMYSAVLLISAVFVFLFVKEDINASQTNEDKSQEEFKFSDLSKIFKNKFIYLHGLIIFCGYIVYWANYYYGGFLQTNVGFSPVAVGSIMVAVLWMRPIGGVVGGFLADKIGQALTITGALICGSLCLGVMVIMPKDLPVFVISAIVIISGFFAYIIRGTYWSLLGQSRIEATIMGTAIGVISFIGYLPDIIIPPINSYLWEIYGEQNGYNAYFIVTMVVGLIGAVLALIYRREQSKIKSEKDSNITTAVENS